AAYQLARLLVDREPAVVGGRRRIGLRGQAVPHSGPRAQSARGSRPRPNDLTRPAPDVTAPRRCRSLRSRLDSPASRTAVLARPWPRRHGTARNGPPMHIPPFSLFAAVRELFVPAGVVYVIARNWSRRPFPIGLFLAVAVFEAFVNVLYMATKAARAAAGAEVVGTGMKIAFAAHGLLSLVAYLVFVVLGVIAWQEQRAGRYFFRE